MRLVALALVCSALAAFSGCSASQEAPESVAPASGTTRVETFTSDAAGFDTHSFWLDTGREVVIFDAQFTPDQARKLLAEIRSKTRNPIAFVVVTHPNPDKFNGAAVFQAEGAKVVAGARTASAIAGVHAYKKYYFVNVAKMFSEATYPAEAKVDITFSGETTLPLQGAEVKLRELSHSGVSSAQTVAFLPAQKALIVGDLVHDKAHAWLEGGIVEGKAHPDLASWKLALDELLSYSGVTVFGGRGVSAPVEEAVARQKAYLDKASEVVSDYVGGLGAARQELDGPDAGKHHKKIASLMAATFPDYQLAYMVEYSVYALASQSAAKK